MKIEEQNKINTEKPAEPGSRPMFGGTAKAVKRRKSIDRKDIRENARGTDGKRAKQSAEYPAKKVPPDIHNKMPMKLPQLPTTPIPVSELPPDSVRSPPSKLPTMIPALSGLTPIPLKDLNNSPAKAAPAIPNPSETISIQVPIPGADGTTIKQTIHVPKSVLSGSSDRILLTVTPKNGVNKGQKQIVVLTKNAAGIGASVKPAASLGSTPQSTPSKVGS